MSKQILLMSHKMNLGGTEKALLSFINALEKKEVSVKLLLLEKGGILYDQIPSWVSVEIFSDFHKIKPIIYNPPLKLIKQDLKKNKWFSAVNHLIRYINVKTTKRWYLNYIAALKFVKKTYQTDIAIAFAGPSDFITYFVHNNILAQQKIQWIHFDVSKMVYRTNFGNKYYQYFDDIYCVSKNAQLVFNKKFPNYSHKTKVFKNIVSKKQLQELAEKGETFKDNFQGIRIVTLGRLSEEKGQLMIPNVVKQLEKEEIKFRWYLIGDGNLKEELQNQINKLKINDKLVLLGAKINPYAYVKNCDIYVQSSYHEGYCLTVHEAKIFNKPVIVTNVASASNLIVDGEDGLIVEISEKGICSGVKRLLKEKTLREKFSQNILSKETINEIDKLIVG